MEVAPNLALEGISVLSTAEEEKIRSTLDDREQQEGVKAGLGHKKKSADRFVLYKNNSRSRGVECFFIILTPPPHTHTLLKDLILCVFYLSSNCCHVGGG